MTTTCNSPVKPAIVWRSGELAISAGDSWVSIELAGRRACSLRGADTLGRLGNHLAAALASDRGAFELAPGLTLFCSSGPAILLSDNGSFTTPRSIIRDLAAWLGEPVPVLIAVRDGYVLRCNGGLSLTLTPDDLENLSLGASDLCQAETDSGEQTFIPENVSDNITFRPMPDQRFEVTCRDLFRGFMSRSQLARLAIDAHTLARAATT